MIVLPYCSKCGREIEALGNTGQSICPNCGIVLLFAPPPPIAPSRPIRPSNIKRNIAIAVILIIIIGIFASASSVPRPETGTQIIAPTRTVTETLIEISSTSNNLGEWAYYAMDWFDSTCAISNAHATRDGLFTMVATYNFIWTYVTYKVDDYAQTPFETLTLRTGQCEDNAILMASLCESVGLDSAINFVNVTSETIQNASHDMCLVHFDTQPEELANELVNLQNMYQMPHACEIWSYKEPLTMIVGENEGFTYADKHATGIWVSIEKWRAISNKCIIDYSNDYLSNFQVFRYLLRHPSVNIGFSWKSESVGNTLLIHVELVNYGAITAKDVTVWTGLDAGNQKVYAQNKSQPFDLSLNENRILSHSLTIPTGVKTRILVYIVGDNFEKLESDGEWFETSANISFSCEWEGHGYILTVSVTVTNYGEVTAKNVIVWAGFDAGNSMVYDAPAQSKSTPFDLAPHGTRVVNLQVKIPRNVHTRILVWIYGDNFEVLKSESDWFNT